MKWNIYINNDKRFLPTGKFYYVSETRGKCKVKNVKNNTVQILKVKVYNEYNSKKLKKEIVFVYILKIFKKAKTLLVNIVDPMDFIKEEK